LAKRERYPFDPQDGITAIQLYSEAADCFQRVGDTEGTRQAVDYGKLMRTRVEDDYTTHRIALDLALDAGNEEDAFMRVNILYGLVQHREGEYKRWLRETGARLALIVAKKEGKGK